MSFILILIAKNMDWQLEFIMSIRLAYAALLGGFIGFERELHASDAGARTYMTVSIGACVFSLVSGHIANEPSRIAAQVVTGIGFIGAGIIFREKRQTSGLTTASTLWATAGIGMASAYGFYILAAEATLFIFLILVLHHFAWWNILIKKKLHSKKNLE